MYKINVDTCLVTNAVYKSKDASDRLGNLLDTIKPEKITNVNYSQLEKYLINAGLNRCTHDNRTGSYLSHDQGRIIVFDTFIWDEDRRGELLTRNPALKNLGWQPFTYRNRYNHE